MFPPVQVQLVNAHKLPAASLLVADGSSLITVHLEVQLQLDATLFINEQPQSSVAQSMSYS